MFAGVFSIVTGGLTVMGWLLRDVLGIEVDFQGSFFPFVMLTVVGAGFVPDLCRICDR